MLLQPHAMTWPAAKASVRSLAPLRGAEAHGRGGAPRELCWPKASARLTVLESLLAQALAALGWPWYVHTPHIDLAFSSVEHIMRDVSNGWFLRYLHANGASVFFIAVYFHMFRALYYGSYASPREALWCIGVVLLPYLELSTRSACTASERALG